MPIRALAEIDVFALVDSDTPEARTYTTYLGYWDCLARHITATHGANWQGPLLTDLEARKPYRALTGRTLFRGNSDELRGLLLNAWNSEVNLYLVDDQDVRLQPAAQWTPVQAYYATGRAALGWLLVRDGAAPRKHRPMLRALASQVAGTSLYPEPWCFHLSSLHPLTWHRFSIEPQDCSNLSADLPPVDGIAKLLKTTRTRRVTELKNDSTATAGRKRARAGELERQDAQLEATTIFDFAWRSRTRSNYGDPSMFYMGSLGSQDRAARFVNSVRTFTNATMLIFEALIAQRAAQSLVEAAVHYMSRDRTKISDALVGERLRTLGLI